MSEAAPAGAEDDDAVRFEDLTVDDDLPIIDRIVHYTASQIALQRLVHVKMLAETAELAGKHATQKVLIPVVAHLLGDAEAVIRQHIAGQLLTLSVVAVYNDRADHETAETYLETTFLQHASTESKQQVVDQAGYELVCETVVAQYLQQLTADPEVDVRRAAADSLAGLALHLTAQDIIEYIMPIPKFLAAQKPEKPSPSKKRTEEEQRMEELRITACHILAEMGGSAAEQQQQQQLLLQFPNNSISTEHQEWLHDAVVPAVLELCQDYSFRVRRAAAQALPRVMGASSLEVVKTQLLPAFEKLSQDDVHRVRKSVGECLVDMSRALMILGHGVEKEKDDELQDQLHELRRSILLPIADRLIQDSHKQVRQGMMQFLGPFMASFYPYQYSALHDLLPASTESDGSHHTGIVAQFFPHASSMVARLNSSQMALSASGSTPTPVHSSLDPFRPQPVTDRARVQHALPAFLPAARLSTLSLAAVTSHRHNHPPRQADLEAISRVLLDYYAALSVVSTGDENTDAEMRVYCAYSFPALVLLLGPENWEGSMQTCFFTLLNPAYGQDEDDEDDEDSNDEDDDGEEGEDGEKKKKKGKEPPPEPPLPVKRCLASSLHTVAHILGPELAARDILPAVQTSFLRDTDDSVRLNMIRNFGALLRILPVGPTREEPFLIWSRVVQGEGFLGRGTKKRSPSNPVVLNWRQRNYLARTLPEIIQLVRPTLLRDHVWPIIQCLLVDAINDVRDDALWSVGVLLRAYCADTVARWKDEDIKDAKKFSAENCAEVSDWIVEHVLNASSSNGNGGNDDNLNGISLSRPTNFSDRQIYCRICGSLGLALRLSEDLAAADNPKDPVSVLSSKFKSLFYKDESSAGDAEDTSKNETGPYQRMTTAEQKHIKKLLMDDFLQHALEMKEDRISNVRITLMKVLQIMPFEIRRSPNVKPVLKTLEEEAETWTSFGEEMTTTQADEDAEQQAAKSSSDEEEDDDDDDGGGPVDMDITPASSRDEDDVPSKKAVAKSLMSGHHDGGGLRKVMFDDGPIGMQLEPTADESAGRVYEFNEMGGGKQSPAVASGKVKIGDVIVKVNGIKVKSYDETIALLKQGGRREIAFRDGRDSDVAPAEGDDDEGKDKETAAAAASAATTDDEDEDEKKKKKKEARKKKHRRKSKSDDASVDDDKSVDDSVDSSTHSIKDKEKRAKKKAKKAKKEKEGKSKSKKSKDEG